jgi:hypothetical protein
MDDLAARRIRTVRDHMALECEHDWDAVITTFEHPRYEMYGSGTVYDGEEAVRGYFTTSRIPFPDQGNEIIAIAHAGDTVLVEFWLTGTHTAAAFEFPPGGDKIICERPYFDQVLVLRALGLA